ncbi:MAG TPA: hypothetical protein VN643_00170 [Pyrinomonadaceae bacterium]|nr:hypothetical protein [Pyrinomonadaceae bacterium]
MKQVRTSTLGGLVIMLMLCASSMARLNSSRTPESPSDSLLKRLEGTWQGEGKTMGMSARLRLQWEWVLSRKFLRLSLKNEMTTPSGNTQMFEGQAYYRSVAIGKFEATWFDSRGWTFPIKADADEKALIAWWGSAETEQGKSIYRFVEPGKLEVIDEVRQKDGTYREFGRFILQRE